MASEANRTTPLDKVGVETEYHQSKKVDLHHDVEAGPEQIDIDRIEEVYK